MSEPGWEQLTLFREDSPASHSPLPGSTRARMMTVTSGQKCLESYERSGPLGSLVRMCLGSSIWHSTRCFLTWKRKDTKQKLSLFQLAVSMHRTEENGAPFWPTLCANGMGSTGHQMMLQKLADLGALTADEKRRMIRGNGGQINPQFAEWLMGYEQQYTKLIPTPTATDYKGGCLSRYWRPSSQTVQVERERGPGLRRPPSESSRGVALGQDWPAEPQVGRVANGVPNRVDRLKCLGNAVVPQQFYPFFAFIAEIEKENNER